MKKLIFAVCACALLLLCACGDTGPLDTELEKAQEIRVVSAGGKLVKTLASDAELDEFSDALDAEEWELVKLPENAELRGEFRLYQTETLKFGQKPEDLKMVELGRLRLYDAPYASLEIFHMELCVELSDAAWEYLDSYFE